MSIKAIMKKLLLEVNPLAQLRRSKMRKRLTNTTPSFLCPNCIGGILFHDLGLKFQSPTVNLMMYQTDFVKFVRNMEHYLAQELVFYRHEEYTFPCAHLDDLTLYFTHYGSERESAEKWRQRKERIDRGNLFIFLEERDGLTEADIRSLKDIHARGLVIFTANAYPDIPYALQIPKYASEGEVGNILRQSYVNASREYEQYFDFVKWFNEAKGGDFSVEAFRK